MRGEGAQRDGVRKNLWQSLESLAAVGNGGGVFTT